LIDVFGEGQAWKMWSVNQLSDFAKTDRLVVNQIVYAEIAPRIGSLAKLEEQLAAFDIDYMPFDKSSAYEAGLAFQSYRKRRGQSSGSVLPDFFIGGHAQVLGATILTRDPRFYRAYFPTVPIITPDSD
jgi:predicted nucleic acid-binding protein